MGTGGPLSSFIHMETASWTSAILKHKGPGGYVNEGAFSPADQTGWLKGLCSKWVGASSSVNSLFFPLAFHGLFPERVSFSWFSRVTKHFSLITVKESFLPFSRQVRRKKLVMNCHIWSLMTTCRGRSYPHNLTRKEGREETFYLSVQNYEGWRAGELMLKWRTCSIAFQNPWGHMRWCSRRGPWEQAAIQRLGRGGGQQGGRWDLESGLSQKLSEDSIWGKREWPYQVHTTGGICPWVRHLVTATACPNGCTVRLTGCLGKESLYPAILHKGPWACFLVALTSR